MGDIGDYWREHKEYVKSRKHVNSVDDFKEGDCVNYMPFHAKGNPKHKDCERGVVTSKNHQVVFVRFGDSQTSQACHPEQLE